MAELIRGLPVPLFDRLSPVVPAYGFSSRILTPQQLQESVARELARLLNTRSSRTVSEFMGCLGTTLDYGLPDVGHLSPHSRPDLDLLESVVRKAIGFFEPRLSSVSVHASFDPKLGGRPLILIGGIVTIGLKPRQLNFELQIDAPLKKNAKVN
jgi:type VI secretion system protein ImpF